jgi:hypothetical protein
MSLKQRLADIRSKSKLDVEGKQEHIFFSEQEVLSLPRKFNKVTFSQQKIIF